MTRITIALIFLGFATIFQVATKEVINEESNKFDTKVEDQIAQLQKAVLNHSSRMQQVEEKNQKLEGKNKILEEKNKILEGKNQILEEKSQMWEEKSQILEKKTKKCVLISRCIDINNLIA